MVSSSASGGAAVPARRWRCEQQTETGEAQDIRDHAGKLPKDEERLKKLIDMANEFATRIHDMDIAKVLNDSGTAMEKNKGTESFTNATKGAEMMMSLVKKIQQNGGMGGMAREELQFLPTLDMTVGQMLRGKGLGGSGGGGFSMSRGGNAGLYGNRPQRVKAAGSGGGKKGGGGGPSSGEKLDDAEGFGKINQFDDGSSGGVPLSAIPSRYRSAVRDFNRRIADEWTGK